MHARVCMHVCVCALTEAVKSNSDVGTKGCYCPSPLTSAGFESRTSLSHIAETNHTWNCLQVGHAHGDRDHEDIF